jgi:hypothetical protein
VREHFVTRAPAFSLVLSLSSSLSLSLLFLARQAGHNQHTFEHIVQRLYGPALLAIIVTPAIPHRRPLRLAVAKCDLRLIEAYTALIAEGWCCN